LKWSGVIKFGGFYIEIKEGGPYLAQDGTVTEYWANRGVWPSRYDAEMALHESMKQNDRTERPAGGALPTTPKTL